MMQGMLAANFPAPTIKVKEGQKLYLTLTNVGMMMRPDLFDQHTIHYHGFPNAAPIFDGVPEAGIAVNMMSSFTYYYLLVHPGTYMYHCHVEATEHMQMGMLGNLYVRPAQNGTLINGFTKFAYNDGDGSTRYDVEFALQLGGFDHVFHEEHLGVQPLPFALMRDDYPMLNGRGYPDTVKPGWRMTPPGPAC
jgi:FtsP/CotA-like multicopper oxidase with cupredoxin domain